MRMISTRFDKDLTAAATTLDGVPVADPSSIFTVQNTTTLKSGRRMYGRSITATLNIDSTLIDDATAAEVEKLRQSLWTTQIVVRVGNKIAGVYDFDELCRVQIRTHTPDATADVITVDTLMCRRPFLFNAAQGDAVTVQFVRATAAAIALQGASVRIEWGDAP